MRFILLSSSFCTTTKPTTKCHFSPQSLLDSGEYTVSWRRSNTVPEGINFSAGALRECTTVAKRQVPELILVFHELFQRFLEGSELKSEKAEKKVFERTILRNAIATWRNLAIRQVKKSCGDDVDKKQD